MITMLSLILSSTFLILSILHMYWGFGGKWAIASTLPTSPSGKNILNPTSFQCFFIAGGLLLFALLPLHKVGLLLTELPSWVSFYGLVAVVAIFFLRALGDFRYVGFFKKIRETQFGRLDTLIYSPLSFVISQLSLLLLLLG